MTMLSLFPSVILGLITCWTSELRGPKTLYLPNPAVNTDTHTHTCPAKDNELGR